MPKPLAAAFANALGARAPRASSGDANFDQGIATSVGRLLFPAYSSSAPKEDTAWMKRVYLYVGKHQRLTGEVKKLPKPMGILRRRPKASTEDADELEIVEVVRHKIVFSTRPEPVSED
ncbi:hypothetical protein, variant [Verruconis gallopava]|uniref:Chromosome transmission fidelity protein 8 n=1 Tax=Verruconis gallopava TaxID=253628 RepID=A0A0D2AIC8_9PEZI|nr:hypothetical protein, variant [Verruconis gallopava]KIW06325.1 hypothetical protein, variant [Verruconis gallopava]